MIMETSQKSAFQFPIDPGKSNSTIDTRQLIDLSEQYGWGLTVLGKAPYPTEPVRFQDWLIIPAIQDTSVIPQEAWERVEVISGAGIRPAGYLVIHELKQEITSLPAISRDQLPREIKRPALSTAQKSTLKAVSGVLGVIATGLALVTGVIVAALLVFTVAAAIAIPALLFAVVTGIDPILVAVMENGDWVEIYRWDV